MSLRLYNTLSRRVEPFEPLAPPRVAVYACGPTVWNYAHVGNFRTFLASDLLRRYLEYSGFDVFLVMNLTDVDDKIIKAAGADGRSIREFTDQYADAFFSDRDFLRIKPAHLYPRATDYIPQMVDLVSTLLDHGIAYRGDDGSVYYGVARFETYGRLARVDLSELRTGDRVSSDEYAKEDVQDFALWKAAERADEAVGAAWDAPFGRGRPGWHLECSAMALSEIRERFGVETLDLHAGGVDLIFPHHENEIAQSEGATGVPFARCWMHGEFLTMAGTKMSKRFGNVLTVRDLQEEGVDPAAFRALVFSTHYRQQLNLTDDAIRAATEGVKRLADFRRRLDQAAGEGQAVRPEEADVLEDEFVAALDEDLAAPQALGAIFTFVRRANRRLDAEKWSGAEARGALQVFDRVTDVLDVLPASAVGQDLTTWVEERLRVREEARGVRDFAKADAIRDELAAKGVELEDTPGGTRWKKRS